MSKPLKKMMIDALRERYEGVESACVVDLTGLDVGSTVAFRSSLHARDMHVRVVKNSLAARAFEGLPLEPLGRSLKGPCALVTGGESVIDVAKALVEEAKEHAAITLKQAIFDGDPDLLTVEQVSKMKGKQELLSELAMLIVSPGRSVAGCVSAPQSKIAGCLQAIADKAEAA